MEGETLTVVDGETLQADHGDGPRVELHMTDVQDLEGVEGGLGGDGVSKQDQLRAVHHL